MTIDQLEQPLRAGGGPATIHFGEHFMLDGYGGDPARLDDGDIVRQALLDICRQVGMRPLAEPQVVHAPDNQLKDPGGWSGFLLIAESHISIHTFPRRRFLTADAYTCKNGMDLGAIAGILTEGFDLKDVESHFVARGLRYPAHNLV